MTRATLSERHLEAFGRIITLYAFVEVGLKVTLTAMLRSDYVHLMTAPYSSSVLQSVAVAITVMHFSDDDPDRKVLLELLDRYARHATLRNHIAHAMWTKGTRAGAVRPVYMRVQHGKAKPRGYGSHEPDYNLEELQQEAAALHAIHQELQSFLNRSGLAAVMEDAQVG